MKEYIAKVAEGENLTEEEAKGAMDIMLSGDATQAQIAAFLALERVKGARHWMNWQDLRWCSATRLRRFPRRLTIISI